MKAAIGVLAVVLLACAGRAEPLACSGHAEPELPTCAGDLADYAVTCCGLHDEGGPGHDVCGCTVTAHGVDCTGSAPICTCGDSFKCTPVGVDGIGVWCGK